MVDQTHPLLRNLNTQQCEAVTVSDGPVLVLAGPGSGKTRVLTHRIAWMLSELQTPAWQILAVTFTNKAARQMRERLTTMVGRETALDMSVGTFHATCARILRREAEHTRFSRDYLILDADDQLALMKLVVKELGLDDKKYRPAALLNAVSHAKNELLTPEQYPIRTYHDEIVARAFTRYQASLRNSNALDFDDLLVEPVRLFQTDAELLEKYRRRFRYILVDEFQDTNLAQYVLLRLLTEEHRSLYAVADEDQSIYSWRGADYRNIRRLRQDYPELTQILLTENYRSTEVILEAAQAVITRNPDRTPKQLFTKKKGGATITLREAYDEQEEAAFVAREIQNLQRAGKALNEIAVMYRTNAQSRALEETFIREKLPYRLIGGVRFYARKEIKDVLAYLRLAQNNSDNISFQRVVNVPARGIGTRTLATIVERATQANCSTYQAAQQLLQERALGSRAERPVQFFLSLVAGWQEARENMTVVALLDRILGEVDYQSFLRDGSEEGESRWENVLALRAVTAEKPDLTLIDFLTEVALVADVDDIDEQVRAVTLLTLHSAKGLEYPIVFITGLEEGLLPHSRSIEDSPEAVAEERRLFYVGITRAEERLYLSYAFRRGWYGNSDPTGPSRFLGDLPNTGLANPKPRTGARSQGWEASGWKTVGTQAPPARRERAAIQPRFRRGQRVHHRRFGDGSVQESVIEGNEEIVTVLFFDNRVGVKQFLASMAPLEPVAEH